MGLTNIQWCDYTFNPWIGCTMAEYLDENGKVRKVPECIHCYAKDLDDNRFSKTLGGASKEHPISHWGKAAPRHRTAEDNWKQPLAWNRKAKYVVKCGVCGAVSEQLAGDDCPARGCDGKMERQWLRPRVFCASLADWLDDEVPIEWLADLLNLISQTPNLDWLLLTKRPQNFLKRLAAVSNLCEGDPKIWGGGPSGNMALFDLIENHWCDGDPPANVWIGVSAGADQAAALRIPARVHFLSCEPMLHAMDVMHAAQFDWIIFGGESGANARPVYTSWIRDGLEFCRKAGVTPFVKQLGANGLDPTGEPLRLKDSHGGDMAEWPADLRVREFPTVR